MSTDRQVSRRTWLKGMALLSAAVGVPLMLASTAAEAKATKSAVHYRDFPNGMRMCHMCKLFISAGGSRSGMMGCPMMGVGMMGHGMMGAGACEVVEGRISPMGYCDLYAPRST
jgi:hypothetical protein